MIIVNSLNESRFTLNGIQYFKNYTTRIAGNNLTIYNAYDNKDVLVPLTPFDQFQVNGSEYDTIEELQIAIIGVCYMRNTLDEGSPLEQNNIGRLITVGTVVPTWNGIGSYTFPAAANYTVDVADKLNDYQYIITANQAPVVVLANIVTDTGTISYKYLFKGGKGTWGVGGAQFEYYMLEYINQQNLTAVDVAENPATNIISLGNLPDADYLTAANSAQRNFNDAGTLNDDGDVISYYFSYTTDNVLYFVQFVGAAGVYNGTLTADDLVSSTNNTVTAEINYENVLQTGNFASIGAIHKDADTGMITEFHGGGFGSTLGEYTQKFLVDVPVGNYTITFPAATQNDNVVYESTLHEGLNSLSLQAVTDNGNTTTNEINALSIYADSDEGGSFGFKSTDTGVFQYFTPSSAISDVAINLPEEGGKMAVVERTIPLSGTEVGSPVTGDIEIQDYTAIKSVTGNALLRLGDGDVFLVGNSIDIGYSDAYITIGDGGASVSSITLNSYGLRGIQDFTSNIQDLDYVQKKYVDEQIGNTIPLTGTEVGSPITGDIEFATYTKIVSNNVEPEGGYSEIEFDDVGIAFSSVGVNTGYFNFGTGGLFVSSNDSLSRGIQGGEDFTANITDLDYTQKKYVDEQLAQQTLQSITNNGSSITLNTDFIINTSGLTFQLKEDGGIFFGGGGEFNVTYPNIHWTFGSGVVDFGSATLALGAEPISPSDVANKAYVDTIVGEKTTRILHNDVTDSTTITGTTDDTILKSFLIPGGTISDGILSFSSMFEKTGISGDAYYRAYINTTNSLTGATRVATLNSVTEARLFTDFRRDFIIKNNGTELFGHPSNNSNANGETESTVAPLNISIDTGTDFYIIISALLADASDSVTQKSFKITYEKATE